MPGLDEAKICGFSGASTIELFAGETLSRRVTMNGGKSIASEEFASNSKLEFQSEKVRDKLIERRFSPPGSKHIS